MQRDEYDCLVAANASRLHAMCGTTCSVMPIQQRSTGTFMNIKSNLNACGYLPGPLDRSGPTAGNSDPGLTQFSGPLGRQQHR